LLILRFASDIFQRGVLFMAGRNEIVGLGQFGLEIEHADENIRKTVLNLDRSVFLKKVVTEQIPHKGSLEKDEVTKELVSKLGGGWPSDAAFFPVIAEGKVVALLYADNASAGEGMPETEGLEIFISHAGLALEKSLLQRRLQEMEKGKNTL
ncbi:MAG: hypothetical protein OEW04_03285, partial [Nitrospirota bacterium]|nr:hypothetical protein [Nitrospirota bacterium]